jgi:asparaginyl-tRNA synthetase
MKREKVADVLLNQEIGKEILVKGWVRTKRGNKNVAFIALNDGSSFHNLQLVADIAQIGEELLKRISTGACRVRDRQ